MGRLQRIVQKTRELLHFEEAQQPPKPTPKPTPKPVEHETPHPGRPIVMFDSTDVTTVPPHAEAVAGYVGGKWPTYRELVKRFPKAHHLSIAVFASEDADCLDIENGDATPSQAPAWVRRQHARKVKRPVLYASLDAMPAVRRALNGDSIKRSEYRLWVAHYTYRAHLEPGYDACQWTDVALGRNLDESLCAPNFFK